MLNMIDVLVWKPYYSVINKFDCHKAILIHCLIHGFYCDLQDTCCWNSRTDKLAFSINIRQSFIVLSLTLQWAMGFPTQLHEANSIQVCKDFLMFWRKYVASVCSKKIQVYRVYKTSDYISRRLVVSNRLHKLFPISLKKSCRCKTSCTMHYVRGCIAVHKHYV